MRIGFGKADVTPPAHGGGPMDLRILGFWHNRAQRYGPIRDPLHARAMAFESEGQRACLMAVDMIGDSIGFSAEARSEIERFHGLPPEAVMITCTHCHTSPETIGLTGHPLDPQWRQALVQGIAQAAGRALASLRPVELALRAGALPGVAFNRSAKYNAGGMARLTADNAARYAFLDETLRVASAAFDDGRRALVVNFTCHPVGVQTQPFISADYPGALTRDLEEAGHEALFVNGPCGDVDPVRMGSYEDVQWVGGRVASGTRELLTSAPQPVEGAIRCVVRSIALPRRPVKDVDALRREESELQAAAARSGPVDPDHPERTPHRRLYMVREALALARMPETIPAEIQALRIGGWLLLGVPGELVGCLGEDIRAAARKSAIWVIGYANGYVGYVTARASFDAGGYESLPGRWSRLAPGGGEMLRDAAVELVRKMDG